MKSLRWLVLLFLVGVVCAEEYPTFSPDDVFKNRAELKGKVVIMFNTQREHKKLSETETQTFWNYHNVTTVTDPARAEKIMQSRTLYVTVTEAGEKSATITVVGNALIGDGEKKTVGWE
jgi:exosome complex RNA-binding protein Rrp42 (RNase PH superfamily)